LLPLSGGVLQEALLLLLLLDPSAEEGWLVGCLLPRKPLMAMILVGDALCTVLDLQVRGRGGASPVDAVPLRVLDLPHLSCGAFVDAPLSDGGRGLPPDAGVVIPSTLVLTASVDAPVAVGAGGVAAAAAGGVAAAAAADLQAATARWRIDIASASSVARVPLRWLIVPVAAATEAAEADSLDLPAAVEQLLRRGREAPAAAFEDVVLCVGRLLDGDKAVSLVVVLPRSRRLVLVPATYQSSATRDRPSAGLARHMSATKSTGLSVHVGTTTTRWRLELHAESWVRRVTGARNRVFRLRECSSPEQPSTAAAHVGATLQLARGHDAEARSAIDGESVGGQREPQLCTCCQGTPPLSCRPCRCPPACCGSCAAIARRSSRLCGDSSDCSGCCARWG